MRCLLPMLLLVACGDPDPKERGTGSPPTSTHPFAGHPIVEAEFMNVAHRGGGDLAPEETLPAFDNAVAVGADMLEMDAWMSTDGVVFLLHDPQVDRTTDGTGFAKQMSWSELSVLDAAYHFTLDGGATYPWRGTGVSIPRLEEVLAAHPDTTYSVEIKQQDPPMVDAVLEILDAHGVADRTVIGSFYDTVLEDVRTKRPEILTSLGTLEVLAFFDEPTSGVPFEPLAYYLASPPDLGSYVLDGAAVDRAHDKGLVVHVWTVNDPDEMQHLVGLGVDGIITDDPATLADLAP